MKLIFKGIYRIVQGIFRVTLRLYFHRIVHINKERLKEEGPLLVISNHPNAMMDPVFAVHRMYTICHLLANAGLFKHPIANFFFTSIFCIPIQRPKDVPDGQPIQNDDAFRRCDEHLLGGGKLYIASEGFSFAERSLRSFRTGTARIAFSAEMKTHFNLNLRILPMGLNYSASQKFGSDIVVELGELISVDAWQADYEKDPRKAVQEFTDYLQNKVRELTVDCRDVDEDEFLKKLEAVVDSENHLGAEATYRRSQKIIKEVHNWQNTDKIGYEDFRNQVEFYFSKLNRLKIKDLNIKKYDTTINTVKLIAGLPIFIYGLINNIIPAWISHKVVKWLDIHPVYDTTVRFVAGLVFFPVFWTIQKNLFMRVGAGNFNFSTPLVWVYFLTMPLIALATWWFYKEWKKYFAYYTFKKADKNGALSDLRQPIVEKLDMLLKEQKQSVLQF